MKCPNCDGRVICTDTRYVHGDSEVYRRRKCDKCGFVIFTIEFEVEYEGEYRSEWIKNKKKYKPRKKTKEDTK